jgi:hypothetical protein
VSWRRDPKAELKSLPLERKVLAERYTIDAEEASRREQFAAEEAARQAAAEEAERAAAAEQARRAHEAEVLRAAAESARRAAEAEAARRAAEQEAAARAVASAAMQRELEDQAHAVAPRELVLASQHTADETQTPLVEPASESAAEPPVEQDTTEQTADLPIYRWFGGSS